MWSLGCVIAELFLGWPLYPGALEYDQVNNHSFSLQPFNILTFPSFPPSSQSVSHLRFSNWMTHSLLFVPLPHGKFLTFLPQFSHPHPCTHSWQHYPCGCLRSVTPFVLHSYFSGLCSSFFPTPSFLYTSTVNQGNPLKSYLSGCCTQASFLLPSFSRVTVKGVAFTFEIFQFSLNLILQ